MYAIIDQFRNTIGYHSRNQLHPKDLPHEYKKPVIEGKKEIARGRPSEETQFARSFSSIKASKRWFHRVCLVISNFSTRFAQRDSPPRTRHKSVRGWENAIQCPISVCCRNVSARKSCTRKETPQDVGIIHIIGRPLLRRSSLALSKCATPSRKADSRVSAFPAWMKCNLSLLKYPYFHSSHIRVLKTPTFDRHGGCTRSLKSVGVFVWISIVWIHLDLDFLR